MVKVSMSYCFSFSRYQTKCVIKFLFRQFDDIINFKGNPNSQGISNWIIQILHYYYSKQHKNIENSQIIKQNLVIFSLCPSLCLLWLALPSPSWQLFFSSLNVTSDHSWNIYFRFFGLKMVFCDIRISTDLRRLFCVNLSKSWYQNNIYPVGMVSTNNQQKIYSDQIYKPS